MRDPALGRGRARYDDLRSVVRFGFCAVLMESHSERVFLFILLVITSHQESILVIKLSYKLLIKFIIIHTDALLRLYMYTD